jgi:hypothetical protein
MLLDPFSREAACRYPDETIVATGLTHLTTSDTFTADPTGTVQTFLRWKVTDFAATAVPTVSLPTPFGAPVRYADYGSPQASWLALDSIDRTLAMGIKARVVALPTSTFLPSGTLYFLQVQEAELNSTFVALAAGEAAAIQAVTAGKGFSMTVNELSKMDGVVLPFLPQGPMSFVFSDRNSIPAATAGTVAGTSSVVSANPIIVVVGYGLESGLKILFDYAHHVEYVPTTAAAGLIATAVEPPSAAAREGIAKASAIVQSHISGSTSGKEVAPLLSGGDLGGLVGRLGKMAIGATGLGGLVSPLASAGASVARGLGAPAWLSSALASLA